MNDGDLGLFDYSDGSVTYPANAHLYERQEQGVRCIGLSLVDKPRRLKVGEHLSSAHDLTDNQFKVVEVGVGKPLVVKKVKTKQ